MSTEAKPSAPAINIGQDTTKPDWGLETGACRFHQPGKSWHCCTALFIPP